MITKPSRKSQIAPRANRDRLFNARDPGATILLIEDDQQIAQLLTAELTDAGYLAEWTGTGESGLRMYRSGKIDLIVLDLSLPDIDGLRVCERIRERDHLTPILMLTARATQKDVIRGLEMGADDYLTKPFETLELLARISSLLRRVAAYRARGDNLDRAEPIQRGTLLMDPLKRETLIANEPVELTAKEFDLLLLFAKHPGRTFTRNELLRYVWGDGFEGYEHTVNTHINRLRNKIDSDSGRPSLIETVWGVGYRFASQVSV